MIEPRGQATEGFEQAVKEFNKHHGHAVIYYEADRLYVYTTTFDTDNDYSMYPERRFTVPILRKTTFDGTRKTSVEKLKADIMRYRQKVAIPKQGVAI